MGIINKGILGGFKGTVGNVVGGSWKGIDYIKSLPTISSTSPTPAQLEQRARFKTVVDFLKPIMPFINISFHNLAVKMTGFNKAFSVNYKNALMGTYPNFSINYSLAIVSSGDLPNVLAPIATAQTGNSNVKFDWTNNAGVGTSNDDDKVMLVIYCPALQQAIYTTASALRSAGTASLDCSQFSGKAVETWISVASANGTDTAQSIYTGQVSVN